MIDRIPLKPTSIEREIFPGMAEEANLYQMALPGYWMDIGQPKDYLSGQTLYLLSRKEKSQDLLTSGPNITGNVWIHPTAKVDPTAQIGPNVAIGADVVIGPGCRIYDSSILARTKIQGYTLIQGSIIGWDNTIGKWVRINGLTVTAQDVQIKDEVFLNGTMILPHKGIAASYPVAGAIVM